MHGKTRRRNNSQQGQRFYRSVLQIRVSANSAIYNQKTLTNTKINERMAKVILTYILRPSVLLDIVHFHEFSCTNIIQYIIQTRSISNIVARIPSSCIQITSDKDIIQVYVQKCFFQLSKRASVTVDRPFWQYI